MAGERVIVRNGTKRTICCSLQVNIRCSFTSYERFAYNWGGDLRLLLTSLDLLWGI